MYYSKNNNFYREDDMTSYVKILHASPNTPNVDIYVNDNLLLSDFAFKELSDYIPIEPGKYNVKVFMAGTTTEPILEKEIQVPAQTRLTLAAIDIDEKISLLPIPESVTPESLYNTHLRFVHLSPGAPEVDILLQNGTELFSNVGYGETTAYISIPRGVYTFLIKPSDGEDAVMTISNVTLSPNFYYTFYIVGKVAGNPPLEVLATVNKTPGLLDDSFSEEVFPLNFEITTPSTSTRNSKDIKKIIRKFDDENGRIYDEFLKAGMETRLARFLIRKIFEYINNYYNRYKGPTQRRVNMAARDLSLLYPWLFEILALYDIPQNRLVSILKQILTFAFEELD